MNTKFWKTGVAALVAAIALAISADHAAAQSATKKALAEKEEAQDAADKAKGEADKAQEKADSAPKNDADKAAEEADQQAEKDEQAARDAQDKADASQAAKDAGEPNSAQKAADDKAAADKANEQAQKSEDAAKKADEKADKGEGKDNPQKINRQKQREKRKKAQKAWEKKRRFEQLLKEKELNLALGPTPSAGSTVATLVASGKLTASIAGTGETIGHIADLKIQNLTDQPLTCAVPPLIFECISGESQHYACPSGQTVALNPHQTKTVPMNGVCLNRNKPPVKGVSGDLVINEANPSGPQNPNSHLPPADAGKLLRSCAAKYTAADQLQKSGALKNLPYHDPQKQKDIVVQWSTWTDPVICQMTGSPPATKEDLRKVVYKQVTEPMTPATRKKIDKGIDTIFEKVELTTAKAKELEKPGPVFTGPVSTEKSGPFFKPAGPLLKPATVAQPGDVVHVEPQSPTDRPGAAAAVGAKGHWMVKVKLPSGKIVEVWFETDDKPPLEFCNWIKINKTGTSSKGNTVIEDYEKTTAPTPTATPAPTPTSTAVPPTVSEPTQTATSSPPLPAPTPTATQPPQLPGGKTEPEKPKDEVVKPTESWEPPFKLPEWLKDNPIWKGLQSAVPGSEFAEGVPGGKVALGALNAKVVKAWGVALEEGDTEKAEFYEKLNKKLTDIFNRMPDKD